MKWTPLSARHAACLAVVIASCIAGVSWRNQVQSYRVKSWVQGLITPLRSLSPSSGLNAQGPSEHHGYEARIFSRSPLIMYVPGFLSQAEVDRILRLSDGRYQPSPLYRGDDVQLDETRRLSDFVEIERDETVKRIEERARSFQGWRGKSTGLQPPRVQRYKEGGFLDYHYDWDPMEVEGNRVTTFMVYLTDNCTGGGTNFPRLKKPEDDKWCTAIDCENAYPGVTFRPVTGSAVFWENMHPNGTFDKGVAHAALPVLSGEKIGLNLWFWDSEWRLPSGPDRA